SLTASGTVGNEVELEAIRAQARSPIEAGTVHDTPEVAGVLRANGSANGLARSVALGEGEAPADREGVSPAPPPHPAPTSTASSTRPPRVTICPHRRQ